MVSTSASRRLRLPDAVGGRSSRRLAKLTLPLLAACGASFAGVGLDTLAPVDGFGPVTVFYPSDASASPIKRGSFTLDVTLQGRPAAGNGRLVVISHSSGGSPRPQSDLSRAWVQAGFVVALPEHVGDNWHDMSKVGPESWTLRSAEGSHAIDAVAADPRFAPPIAPDRIGVYGMSAGGHAALVMAGGRWSPGSFARYCSEHIAEDFPACVGLITRLKGNGLDPVKIAIARQVLNWRFSDGTWRQHHDPRVRAVIAAVPAAASFEPASLAHPTLPLGLIAARKDAWLAPRFHVDAVRDVCTECVVVADLADGGHGAVLSPLPNDLAEAECRLLADLPGFDRGGLPAVCRAVADFFKENLLP